LLPSKLTLRHRPIYKGERVTGGVMGSCVLRFGEVGFDEAQRRLWVAGKPVDLDRSCVAVLSVLIHQAGEDVNKDRLLEAGWPGRMVHENSLAKAIGRLRQALGPDGRALETVHGYGYRLAADVQGEVIAEPRHRSTRPAGGLKRLASAVVAVILVGLATWGPTASQAEKSPRVINGEAADAVGRVLWVDDHPENNAREKRYLENHRIAVYQVRTTEDALTLLPLYQYGVVISDMGRGERPLAGMDLLKEMRVRGDPRPFLIYTVHSSPAQRRLVAGTGGQAVIEKREKLYAAILPLFGRPKDRR
jgi:DNA-binding response OmpR family regulator